MQLHTSSDSSEHQQEMARVLTETFSVMQTELNSLPSYQPASDSVCVLNSGTGVVGEERTLALLEQYSLLLLRAVEKRMDNKI